MSYLVRAGPMRGLNPFSDWRVLGVLLATLVGGGFLSRLFAGVGVAVVTLAWKPPRP
jgi:hypothetical protein